MSFSEALPLHGKKALVTGASRGIGKGIALALAAAGADVAVNHFQDEARASDVVAEITKLGRAALATGADVRSSAEVARMFSACFAKWQRLDILINNAGVQVFKPLLEASEAEWDLVTETNLKGCFLCTQTAARHMREQGSGGTIINIGSGCNRLPFPNLASYTASKGGIEMFTKAAAVELGQYGVRVNCVAPGAIEVERTLEEAGDYAKTWSELTPMARIGYPTDVAAVVCFLASDAARFTTGQTVGVDGGLFVRPAWPYPF